MIELLENYLQEWRNKKDILLFLNTFHGKVNERQFRQEKKKWNKLYKEHKVSQFLAHSNIKGYKLTTDKEEIIKAENDFIKRGKNVLYEAYSIRKARIENNNYSFEDFLEEQKKFDVEATELT